MFLNQHVSCSLRKTCSREGRSLRDELRPRLSGCGQTAWRRELRLEKSPCVSDSVFPELLLPVSPPVWHRGVVIHDTAKVSLASTRWLWPLRHLWRIQTALKTSTTRRVKRRSLRRLHRIHVPPVCRTGNAMLLLRRRHRLRTNTREIPITR